MRAVPLVGARKPVSTFMVVVLPAPLGPRKAATWPLGTVNDTSLSAWKLPYTLESFSAWIMMGASVIAQFPYQLRWRFASVGALGRIIGSHARGCGRRPDPVL